MSVEGRCNACGFIARREVHPAGGGPATSMLGVVETVLVESPDEPEPVLLAEFEEVADTHLTGGRGRRVSPIEADLISKMAGLFGSKKP